MGKRTLLGSLVLSVGLLAAGCTTGNDGADAAPPTSDVAPPAPDAAPPAADAAADPVLQQGDEEIHGSFSMLVMAHTTSYVGTDVGQEQQPNPWDGGEGEGPYRYAAIPCNEDAPLNNISGDLPTFNTLIPGSRVPASTRAHPLEFEVSAGDDGQAQLEGTLDLTVCQLRPGVTPDPDPVQDAEKDRIRFRWTARAAEATDETVVWRGTVEIAGGTGPYEQLTGEGDIAGYFFCFAPEGCEELGEFRDVQFTMAGTYSAPAAAIEEATATETP